MDEYNYEEEVLRAEMERMAALARASQEAANRKAAEEREAALQAQRQAEEQQAALQAQRQAEEQQAALQAQRQAEEQQAADTQKYTEPLLPNNENKEDLYAKNNDQVNQNALMTGYDAKTGIPVFVNGNDFSSLAKQNTPDSYDYKEPDEDRRIDESNKVFVDENPYQYIAPKDEERIDPSGDYKKYGDKIPGIENDINKNNPIQDAIDKNKSIYNVNSDKGVGEFDKNKLADKNFVENKLGMSMENVDPEFADALKRKQIEQTFKSGKWKDIAPPDLSEQVDINGNKINLPSVKSLPSDFRTANEEVARIRDAVNKASEVGKPLDILDSIMKQKDFRNQLGSKEMGELRSFITNYGNSNSSNWNTSNTSSSGSSSEISGGTSSSSGSSSKGRNGTTSSETSSSQKYSQGSHSSKSQTTQSGGSQSSSTGGETRTSDNRMAQLEGMSGIQREIARLAAQQYDNERSAAAARANQIMKPYEDHLALATAAMDKAGVAQNLKDGLARSSAPKSAPSGVKMYLENANPNEYSFVDSAYKEAAQKKFDSLLSDPRGYTALNQAQINLNTQRPENLQRAELFGNPYNTNVADGLAIPIVKKIVDASYRNERTGESAGEKADPTGALGDMRTVGAVATMLSGKPQYASQLRGGYLNDDEKGTLALTAHILEGASRTGNLIKSSSVPVTKQTSGSAPVTDYKKPEFNDMVKNVFADFSKNPDDIGSKLRALGAIEVLRREYPSEFGKPSNDAGVMDMFRSYNNRFVGTPAAMMQEMYDPRKGMRNRYQGTK